jgi:hypothetical protein
MKTIEITLDDCQKFEFSNEEPTITDESKIISIMTDLLGGWDKVAELENNIVNNYRRHIEHNREKYGDEFENMHKRYLELKKEKDESGDEYKELSEKINSDKYFDIYQKLLFQRTITKNYAWMQVMLVNPKSYNFLTKQEDFLIKVWSKVIEKKIPNTKNA